MDADCSLAASLLALDSEAAWELPELAELLSLLELLWEAELLSPESAWDELPEVDVAPEDAPEVVPDDAPEELVLPEEPLPDVLPELPEL